MTNTANPNPNLTCVRGRVYRLTQNVENPEADRRYANNRLKQRAYPQGMRLVGDPLDLSPVGDNTLTPSYLIAGDHTSRIQAGTDLFRALAPFIEEVPASEGELPQEFEMRMNTLYATRGFGPTALLRLLASYPGMPALIEAALKADEDLAKDEIEAGNS